MKRIDTIRRASRSLRQAKTRTFLTSMAIAVGAFTLTLSIAAGEGSRQYADKIITSNIDPQSLYVAKDKMLVGGGGGPATAGGVREYSPNAAQYGGLTLDTLDADDLETIRNTEGVERVIPTYLVEAQYMTFEGNKKRYVSDITVYDKTVRAESAAGDMPALGEQIADDQAVLPEAFLKTIGVSKASDIVGKEVTLRLVKQPDLSEEQIDEIIRTQGVDGLRSIGEAETRDVTLTVRAVSKQSATSLSASNALFISENKAKELSDYMTRGTDSFQTYIAVTATASDGVDPQVVKERLEKNDIFAMTAEDIQGLLFTVVNVIQGIVIGFGVLALIASIFGIVNTQYISVLERVREIGLMKSLGLSSKHVSRLFRYEAAWIGFLGGVLGAGLAWLVGTVLNPWLTELLGIGEGTSILVFQPAPVVLLIITLMLVAIIAGWFPARKAAKLDPIEALRTE